MVIDVVDSLMHGGLYVIYSFESVIVFFFKQKTAYEMRISDWSSDVCSSDLQSSSPILPSAAEMPPCAATVCERVGNTLEMQAVARPFCARPKVARKPEIGRASCRARVCQCV